MSDNPTVKVDKRFAVKADTSHNDEILEVYTHDIFLYADEYINTKLKDPSDKNDIKDNFDNMIFYIRHRIPKPDNNNIELLDHLFMDVFLELCTKCYVLPTLENFSLMLSISPNTLSAWKAGEYRKLTPEYSLTVKNWSDICKGRLLNTMTQSKGGDINRIFIAKAVYGMAETAPVQVATQQVQTLDNKQLAARLGDRVERLEVIEDVAGKAEL